MHNHLHNYKTRFQKRFQPYWLLMVTLFISPHLFAQLTVSTAGSFLNNNGNGTVTFNVQNNNSFDIIITEVKGVTGSSGALTAELYFNTTPVSGAPVAIDSANGWTLAASGAFTGVANSASTVTQTFLSGITFIVPANTTYGMAVFATGQRYYTHPGGVSYDSTGGVSIVTGTNIGYGGGTPPTAPGNSPRGWIGELVFMPAIACSGTPYAGNAVSNMNTVCGSSSFLLSLENDSLRTGVEYQWQSSTSGLPLSYTDMLDDTTRTISATQTATTWYRCITTCGGVSPDTSTAVVVNTPTLAFNGVYTLDQTSPASATNFQSLNDFITTLNCLGVTGPVTLNIVPNTGPYYENTISLGTITGVTATDSLVINGNGNIIEITSSPMVAFSGSEYITLNGLHLTGTSGIGIHIGGQSHHLTISNNIIDVGTTATATSNAGIVVSGSTTSPTTTGNNAHHLTITNNEVIGGYYGMTFMGSGSYLNNYNHLIQNNTVRDFYLYGIYLSSADSVRLIGNDINRANRGTVSTFYGVYATTCRNVKYFNNIIHDAGVGSYTSYPFYITTSVNSTGYESEFINNQIYNVNGGSTLYAFYLTTSPNGLNLFHNTVSLDVDAGSGTVRGIFINTGASNINIKNNNVVINGTATGTKHCIYTSTTVASIQSDYNNFFMNATGGTNNHVGYWTANRATLSAWQTASTRDSNSVSLDPVFINPAIGNFEPFVATFDNLGTYVGVDTDINGTLRSTTQPDIGSVEFTIPFCTSPPVAGQTLSDNATVCKGQSFTLSFDTLTTTGIGQTYQWEVATDSVGPYTAMPNDTNIFAVASQMQTRWYRIALTCSGLTSYTAPVMVYTDTTFAPAAITIDTAIAVSATNFHNLSDAINLMNCKGVSGPTTITFATNNTVFNDVVNFGMIAGTSPTNTITIYGNGNTIENTAAIVAAFSGTGHVIIDSLNIVASGSTGYAVHMTNETHHITIRKSRIEVNTTSTSTLTQPFVVSGLTTSNTAVGNNAHDITVENNEIIGGYYSMTFIGDASGTYNYGHVIKNNIVRDFYIYGIYMNYADSSLIENNDIHRMNRSSVSTLYAIYNANSKYMRMIGNSIHHTGIASYSAYPFYLSNLSSDTLYESEIINNRIYNINHTSGTFYGIYALSTSLANAKIYHNTIQYETPSSSTSTIRGFFCSVSNTNVDFRNNIISITGGGSGVKTGIYISSTSTSFISNNNAVFVNTGASDNYGYWGGTQATLSSWQTASGQGANSVESDPAFTDIANNNLIPLSGNLDNIGAPVGVLTDFDGATRSLTTPDPGAYEFTGVAGDIAIIEGELIRSGDCYSFNDTVSVTVQNIIGTTIDFGMNPLNINWSVTGPQTSSGILSITFGTLAPGNSITVKDFLVNRSAAGTYTLNASLQANAVNLFATNDTLQAVNSEVKPILSVTPKTVTVNNPTDTVVLKATSPLFPATGLFITEVAHYKYTVGQPTTGWPSYLLADDYIEVTGIPNSDLAGITLEQYDGSSLVGTYTFPTGTLLSPSGTAVIAIGQLGSSANSPLDFYYNGNGTYTGTWGSGTAAGVLLRSATGTIIDAVGYGTYTFPASSGVTASDWSGNTPTGTTTSGNRLVGADVNSATNWVNSSTAPQDPNTVNSGVTVPSSTPLIGFDWTYLGTSFSTNPTVTVGPYTTPGVYTYIASFSNACGTFYDTTYVTASATVPVKMVSFTAEAYDNKDALLNWQTASEVNNSHFEVQRSSDNKNFKTIGKVKGNGNATRLINYQFVDHEAISFGTKLYYRLVQVDFNGESTPSHSAPVRFKSNSIEAIAVAPNPFNSTLNLSVDAVTEGVLSIRILDIQGRLVSTSTHSAAVGNNTIQLSETSGLDKGFYFVQVNLNGEAKVIKILKN